EHAEGDFGETDFAGAFEGDADVGGHGDLQSAANGVSVQRGDDKLRRLLEAQQRLVRVQAEEVFESGGYLGQHLDVRAGGEELVACAAEHDHVHFVVHARAEDALIQFAVHFVGVGVCGRIVQLENRHALFDS